MPVTPSPFEILGEALGVIFEFFLRWGWIFLPVALAYIFWYFWIAYIQTRWASSLKWIMLEIRLPQEVPKPIKAMEQVFLGMFSLHQAVNKIALWWVGEFQPWASFEIFAHEGGVHFFVRVPQQFRQMTEALIYSEYPQAEISEAEDYTLRYRDLPNDQRDLWGTELLLAQDPAYPIRTYEYYEAEKEEKRLDPLAPFIEQISQMKPGEEVWFQVIIQPPDDRGKAWIEKGRQIVAKLAGKKIPKKVSLSEHLWEFFINFLRAPFELPTWSFAQEKKEGEPPSQMLHLTPGEKTTIEAIEKKISLLAFQTTIRWLYHGPVAIFSKTRISEILSSFRQFTTHDLNSLKLNSAVTTKIEYPWQLKSRRELLRKRSLFQTFQNRELSPGFTAYHKNNILNVEELATLYHIPLEAVATAKLHRLEFKKGAPPPTLPTEEM